MWPKRRPSIVLRGALHRTGPHDHGAQKSPGTDVPTTHRGLSDPSARLRRLQTIDITDVERCIRDDHLWSFIDARQNGTVVAKNACVFPCGQERVAAVKQWLAHVRRNDDGSFAIHDLEEHLRTVGDLAGEFASSFGHSDWGRLAGLWHDLGKYSSAFQSYIARGDEIVA